MFDNTVYNVHSGSNIFGVRAVNTDYTDFDNIQVSKQVLHKVVLNDIFQN